MTTSELKPLTVKQLREKLDEMPDDLPVCFDTEASCWGCHMAGVHGAYEESIEEEDGDFKFVGLNCHDAHVPCRAVKHMQFVLSWYWRVWHKDIPFSAFKELHIKLFGFPPEHKSPFKT